MQIWIVNHYAIPATQVGGTRHFSMARELIRRGHRVTIFSSAFLHTQRSGKVSGEAATPTVRRESIDGVEFVWIRTPPYRGNGLARVRNMLSFALRTWSIGRREECEQPDVIVGSSPHPFAAYAALRLARRFQVPFVLEIRDLWPDSLIAVTAMSRSHPLVVALRWLERHLYRSAAQIVSLLPNTADHISRHGGHRDRITWIPNGVDFRLAPPAEPRRSGAPFTVAYAGTHGRANAVDSMLDAARLLRDEDPGVYFRFIGQGPERERLRQLATAEQLTRVRFDDPVPKDRIYEVLQDADVLLATTRNIDLYAHGLSFNKLFDYLATGRPIVFGANSPGNPVEEASAGEVVPPEDSAAMAAAIRQIATMSPAERWAIGLRGRRFAEEHYNIEKLAERFEGVLARAVEPGLASALTSLQGALR